MELRHLKAFVAVADELHFGRAADRLGIVQPAVSQLIRRLEAELDVVLFERSSHHVALTGAGVRLLVPARQAVLSSQEVARTAAAIAGGDVGVLRVATSEGTGPSLNYLLERFARLRPDVALNLTAQRTDAKITGLREGTIDVAFLRSAPNDPGLSVEPLWSEPVRVVLPAQHHAARADPVSLPELAALPLILGPRSANPAVHDALLAVCREAGFEPRLGPVLQTVQETIATVGAGAAWTLLTAPNAPAGRTGVAVRALPEPQALSDVSLAWRSATPNAQTLAFVTTALAARDDGALPAPPGAPASDQPGAASE